MNAGTRAPVNADEIQVPVGVPAKGGGTETFDTEPSGANVTVARPLPLGPSGRLQEVARPDAAPS